MPQPIFQKGQKIPVLYKGAFGYEPQIWNCKAVRAETGECLLISPDKRHVTVVAPDGTMSNEDVMLPEPVSAGLTMAESEELEELLSMFMDDQPMTPEQVERLNKLEMQVISCGMY